MLADYVRRAMRQANYQVVENDRIYGEVPGFVGVSATAETLMDCQHRLVEILEDWVVHRISRNLPVPPVEGVDLPSDPH
uniref:Type II toxin-antitoxin system HicB family antitoxin n=1 Tax=Cyanothece sp. (strain PCC 7425 / ATCC 29141) TaxID=395961 RepID=B8HQ11_CYAP4